MKKVEHTPGLLTAPSAGIYVGPMIDGRAKGPMIATIGTAEIGESRQKHGLKRFNIADARHLVLCWNSHDELLEACEAGRVYCEALQRAWKDGTLEDVGSGAIVRSATKELDTLFNRWASLTDVAIAKAESTP